MKSIAQAQELKFLALTLALVLIVGTGTLINLIQVPEVAIAESKAARVPASVPSSITTEAPRPLLKSLETLDWSCGEQGKVVHVTSPRLRVVGKPCGANELSIQNETNGLIATVIEGEKGFSTDYLELNVGENRFAVNWTDNKGRSQKAQITIIKE